MRDRLAEVVENLLSNAAKYSPGRRRDPALRPAASGRRWWWEWRTAASASPRRTATGSSGRSPACAPRRTARRRGLGARPLHLRPHRAGPRRPLRGGERARAVARPSPSACPSSAPPRRSRAPLVLVAARDGGTRRDVRRVAEALGYGTHEVADGVEALEAALRLKPSVGDHGPGAAAAVRGRAGRAPQGPRHAPATCPCSPWPPGPTWATAPTLFEALRPPAPRRRAARGGAGGPRHDA